MEFKYCVFADSFYKEMLESPNFKRMVILFYKIKELNDKNQLCFDKGNIVTCEKYIDKKKLNRSYLFEYEMTDISSTFAIYENANITWNNYIKVIYMKENNLGICDKYIVVKHNNEYVNFNCRDFTPTYNDLSAEKQLTIPNTFYDIFHEGFSQYVENTYKQIK